VDIERLTPKRHRLSDYDNDNDNDNGNGNGKDKDCVRWAPCA